MTPNSNLSRACGLLGLIGAGAPILTDIISWFLAENYSPIENSISNLAVGPASWLVDAGLWCLVISCAAVAAGLWTWRIHARYWIGAVISLLLLAVSVAIIARVNEYAGTQNQGADLHQWAVYGIGLFFALAALLAVPGLRVISDETAWLSMGLGIAWIVLTPVYYLAVPDSWSGAMERLLALIILVWLATIAQRLRRSGSRAGSSPSSRS